MFGGRYAVYVLRRLIAAVVMVLFVVFIGFSLTHLSPGDPAAIIAGGDAPPEVVQAIRTEWGLDKPFLEQLLTYYGHILSGDLGISYRHHTSVVALIAQKLPVTLELVGLALVLGNGSGIVAAVLSVKPGSRFGRALSAIAPVVYAIPGFWLGLILILVFAVSLNILPAGGSVDVRAGYTGIDAVYDQLKHLILPLTALSLRYFAVFLRLTRATLTQILGEDYILTARAKGLTESLILYRHALKNAMRPIISYVAMETGGIFGRTVLIEVVFSWPGLGRLMYDSLFQRDFPVTVGLMIAIAAIVVTACFIADLVQLMFDPRSEIA